MSNVTAYSEIDMYSSELEFELFLRFGCLEDGCCVMLRNAMLMQC